MGLTAESILAILTWDYRGHWTGQYLRIKMGFKKLLLFCSSDSQLRAKYLTQKKLFIIMKSLIFFITSIVIFSSIRCENSDQNKAVNFSEISDTSNNKQRLNL
jgi:hypothetical protein